MNMAIDEALLQRAKSPSIRFYQWSSPALSFGYFGKFSDVTEYATERDLVRRWTGGGIVFHGEDLTYSIVIPANDSVFGESSMSIYEKMHRALRDALIANAQLAELAAVIGSADAVACFANPVHADVMIDGRKVAGAAQRRTRSGLLQQGSIQGVDLGDGLAERFAKELSDSRKTWVLPDAIHYQAQEIATQKYGTESWLRKR
jgi:lipoate-protein ligase A